MNKNRLKVIEKVRDVISGAEDMVEAMEFKEQEYYDGVPENLQGTSQYERSETALEKLGEAKDLLGQVKDLLEEIE